MMSLYHRTNLDCSRLITRAYSTSFSMGIMAFDKKLRMPIYGIYGFVRYADEIVDTFHEHDKQGLLEEFKTETWKAIDRKISLNPVLDSFQQVVNAFNIDRSLIEAFLHSMEMDLSETAYNSEMYQEYIYGSAEVVGLMCLKVFCEGKEEPYQQLKGAARALGAAFQKVNFLRDIRDDYQTRGRTYFPELNLGMKFDAESKVLIEKDIEADFQAAYEGILKLPNSSKFGVLTAYWFYKNLFSKIRKTRADEILNKRIRINNFEKAAVLAGVMVRYRLNLI